MQSNQVENVLTLYVNGGHLWLIVAAKYFVWKMQFTYKPSGGASIVIAEFELSNPQAKQLITFIENGFAGNT